MSLSSLARLKTYSTFGLIHTRWNLHLRPRLQAEVGVSTEKGHGKVPEKDKDCAQKRRMKRLL